MLILWVPFVYLCLPLRLAEFELYMWYGSYEIFVANWISECINYVEQWY